MRILVPQRGSEPPVSTLPFHQGIWGRPARNVRAIQIRKGTRRAQSIDLLFHVVWDLANRQSPHECLVDVSVRDERRNYWTQPICMSACWWS